MQAIAFTPYITVEQDRHIPSKFVPLVRDGNRSIYENGSAPRHMLRNAIEQVYLMADVVAEYKISDLPESMKDAIVLFVTPVTNTFCGGECIAWVGVLKKSKARSFGACVECFFVSIGDDGLNHVAFPA